MVGVGIDVLQSDGVRSEWLRDIYILVLDPYVISRSRELGFS